jgi:hypothetical protein
VKRVEGVEIVRRDGGDGDRDCTEGRGSGGRGRQIRAVDLERARGLERHPEGSRPSAVRSGRGKRKRRAGDGDGRRRRERGRSQGSDVIPMATARLTYVLRRASGSSVWNSGSGTPVAGKHVGDTRNSGRSGEFESVTRNRSRSHVNPGPFGHFVPACDERKISPSPHAHR